MTYKRIFIHFIHSGFYDVGFIKFADVKEMEDGHIKEVLLNIFKYSLAETDERIKESYEVFCDMFGASGKADSLTFNKFLKLLKEKRKDVDFAYILELQHIDGIDNNIMIKDMIELLDVTTTLFRPKNEQEELEDWEKWEVFNKKEYSENTTLKVESYFSNPRL